MVEAFVVEGDEASRNAVGGCVIVGQVISRLLLIFCGKSIHGGIVFALFRDLEIPWYESSRLVV